jgi:hypothetical protein
MAMRQAIGPGQICHASRWLGEDAPLNLSTSWTDFPRISAGFVGLSFDLGVRFASSRARWWYRALVPKYTAVSGQINPD